MLQTLMVSCEVCDPHVAPSQAMRNVHEPRRPGEGCIEAPRADDRRTPCPVYVALDNRPALTANIVEADPDQSRPVPESSFVRPTQRLISTRSASESVGTECR